MTTPDIIGFVGIFLILIAYLLNLLKVLSINNVLYILMNIFGAGIACYASFLLKYLPFILLEGIWTLISIFALFRIVKTKSSISDKK